jgi:hypothetical protein
MKVQFISAADWMYQTGINYTIGDYIVAKEEPMKIIGKCTGFKDGCILIDGRNYGGKYFFMKSEWQEVQLLEGGNNEQQ